MPVKGEFAMSSPRDPETLTFREKLRDCAHLTRELVEHLEQAFEPRVEQIKSTIRSRPGPGDNDVPDVTVRNLVATLLEGDDFAQRLCQRLEKFGPAILRESERILNSGHRAGS